MAAPAALLRFVASFAAAAASASIVAAAAADSVADVAAVVAVATTAAAACTSSSLRRAAAAAAVAATAAASSATAASFCCHCLSALCFCRLLEVGGRPLVAISRSRERFDACGGGVGTSLLFASCDELQPLLRRQ